MADFPKSLLGDGKAALRAYEESLAILKKLHAANKLDHEKQSWIPVLEDAINQQ